MTARGGTTRQQKNRDQQMRHETVVPDVSTHPDLPDTLVHFTGRPRGRKERRDFPPTTPEQRLASILHRGALRGAPDFWSDAPVICCSEATKEARRAMLRDGVGRGRYAPWGLVLDRRQLECAGARPALPVSREELNQMKAALPPRTYNRCVVYEPNPARGRSDWLHEREWRICFEDGDSMLPVTPQLVVGVIVGTQGWMPPPHTVTPKEKSTKFVTAVLAVRRAMQENHDHPWQSIPVHSPDVSFAWPAHGLARW